MAIFDSWNIEVGVDQIEPVLGFVPNFFVLWKEIIKKKCYCLLI
jgi:hypothetical protein